MPTPEEKKAQEAKAAELKKAAEEKKAQEAKAAELKKTAEEKKAQEAAIEKRAAAKAGEDQAKLLEQIELLKAQKAALENQIKTGGEQPVVVIPGTYTVKAGRFKGKKFKFKDGAANTMLKPGTRLGKGAVSSKRLLELANLKNPKNEEETWKKEAATETLEWLAKIEYSLFVQV